MRHQNKLPILFRAVSGIAVEIFVTAVGMAAAFIAGALILKWFHR